MTDDRSSLKSAARKRRYDIAPDTGPDRDQPPMSWWVVDMRTYTGDPVAYPNVGAVDGPFRHAGAAFARASYLNSPWWKRLYYRLGLDGS